MSRLTLSLAVLIAAASLAGCETVKGWWGGGPKATASLEPTKGSTVRGTANFEQRGDKVRVSANVSGISLRSNPTRLTQPST